jgi:hypothetical protein
MYSELQAIRVCIGWKNVTRYAMIVRRMEIKSFASDFRIVSLLKEVRLNLSGLENQKRGGR